MATCRRWWIHAGFQAACASVAASWGTFSWCLVIRQRPPNEAYVSAHPDWQRPVSTVEAPSLKRRQQIAEQQIRFLVLAPHLNLVLAIRFARV
jgi:hypothetical protein